MQTIDIYGGEFRGKPCPFCEKAVAFCEEKRLPFRFHDVRSADVRAELMGRLPTPPKTIPVVMVGKIEVAGGYDGLVKAWGTGILQQILQGE